jgi:hypothetical protein
MKRLSRRLVWVAVAQCVVALAFGLTHLLLSPFPGVTAANCARLRPGMSQQEVEQLFGGPSSSWKLWPPDTNDYYSRSWEGDEGTADVTFGRDGRVRKAEFDPGSTLHRPVDLRSRPGW